jgi:hypothetical protein
MAKAGTPSRLPMVAIDTVVKGVKQVWEQARDNAWLGGEEAKPYKPCPRGHLCGVNKGMGSGDQGTDNEGTRLCLQS